jgi:6-methylsalicylate decarboxylase
MRIDVHAHLLGAEYISLMETSGLSEAVFGPARNAAHSDLATDLAERFQAMDRAQVTMQVLSIGSIVPSFEEQAANVEAARVANDLYAELVQQHPSRFAYFATVPLPHVDSALAEFDRVSDRPAMLGVTMTTAMLGNSVTDTASASFYEELDRRSAVLFAHPSGNCCESPVIAREGLTWMLGAPFEDTLCALQVLKCGFLDRYPHIQVVVPHLGGTLPFLLERIDYMSPRFMPAGQRAAVEARRLWYDTVNGYPPALACAVEAFGDDRILFGTDYPLWRGDAHQLAADHICNSGLRPETVDAIFHGNARQLFGERLTPPST